MTSFDRVAIVDIETKEPPAIRVRDLRIAFDIEKTRDTTANRALIQVYNLAPATRGRIKDNDIVVQLLAGYAQGDGPKLIFKGEIRTIVHKRQGPDVVTTIETQDGVVPLRDTRLTASYAPSTDAITAVREIAAKFGIPVKLFDEPVGTFDNGYAFAGPAKDALEEVCRRFDLEWSVQDGAVQVVAAGGTTSEPVILLSADSGLIGNPERLTYKVTDLTNPRKRTKAQADWRVRSLLHPDLNPARKLRLESIDVKGDFSIETLKHAGDTHGDDWLSEVEVKALV